MSIFRKLTPHKRKIQSLMVISAVLVCLGLNDAITHTNAYNNLDHDHPLRFRIKEKYNKKQTENFPDLNFNGVLLQTGESAEIKVSRGDYDKKQPGDDITVFRSRDGKEFMTEYEIGNQVFIHIGGKGYSFVFIFVFLFSAIGILCIYALIRIAQLKK